MQHERENMIIRNKWVKKQAESASFIFVCNVLIYPAEGSRVQYKDSTQENTLLVMTGFLRNAKSLSHP